MKVLLPLAGFFFAAGSLCCCCGDLGDFNPEEFGIKVPDQELSIDVGTPPSVSGSAMAPIAASRKVTVLDISSEDAYFSDKATIVGKACVTQEETSFKDGGWHGGSVSCLDGSTYYFYKAALSDSGITVTGALSVPTGGGAAPAAGIAYQSVPSGTRVEIVDVATDDAYHSDRATIVGKHCVTEEATSFKDGSWHGGSIRCNDGSSYYFYKAQLKVE